MVACCDSGSRSRLTLFPLFMGMNAGAIHDIKPAAQIVAEMVDEAAVVLRGMQAALPSLQRTSRL